MDKNVLFNVQLYYVFLVLAVFLDIYELRMK